MSVIGLFQSQRAAALADKIAPEDDFGSDFIKFGDADDAKEASAPVTVDEDANEPRSDTTPCI